MTKSILEQIENLSEKYSAIDGYKVVRIEDIKPLIQEWEERKQQNCVHRDDGNNPPRCLKCGMSLLEGEKDASQDRLEKAIEECGEDFEGVRKIITGIGINGFSFYWRAETNNRLGIACDGSTPLLAVENLKKALEK